MIGILLITHGDFAKGIVDSMEMICGPQDNLRTLSLRIADDVEVFAEEIKNTVAEMNDGSGVLILTDLLGGSPANMVCRFLLQETAAECLSGLNFPMLIEAVSSREYRKLPELAEACREAGCAGIVNVKEVLADSMDDPEDD